MRNSHKFWRDLQSDVINRPGSIFIYSTLPHNYLSILNNSSRVSKILNSKKQNFFHTCERVDFMQIIERESFFFMLLYFAEYRYWKYENIYLNKQKLFLQTSFKQCSKCKYKFYFECCIFENYAKITNTCKNHLENVIFIILKRLISFEHNKKL